MNRTINFGVLWAVLLTLIFIGNAYSVEQSAENVIWLKQDNAYKNTEYSVGHLLLNKPGISIIIPVEGRDKNLDEISQRDVVVYGDSIRHNAPFPDMEFPNDCIIPNDSIKSSGETPLPHGLHLAGGSSSLDRLTSFTFVFVEGNGPSEFNWIEDSLNFMAEQANLAVNDLVSAAAASGIYIKAYIILRMVGIGYEPCLETNGTEYYHYTVEGLDPWRSAVVGAMGFEPNLRGLLNMNIANKADVGCAEGVTCFIINMGNS